VGAAKATVPIPNKTAAAKAADSCIFMLLLNLRKIRQTDVILRAFPLAQPGTSQSAECIVNRLDEMK
jgi:hypothetical protein